MHDALFEATEAVADITAPKVHHTEVGELYVHRSRSSPSTVVVGVKQTQLVDPNLSRLYLVGDVTHTYHHHLHLAQRGVTHHAHCVGRNIRIGRGEELRIRGDARGLGLIAGFFHTGKDVEVDIQHVGFRPHHLPVCSGVFAVVTTVRRQFQRDHIFVVVVLIVTTQTDEDSQLSVFQTSGIGNKVVGMYKHLHVFVLAEVHVHVTIDGLRLLLLQILHYHVQGLFVVLHELGL